jgi:hypothetical protein
MKAIFIKIIPLLFFFSFGINVAQAITFKNYDELNDCVDFYNTFSQYKKNLQKCFEEKDIQIDNDSLKLIKKDYGLIESIIDLNLPEEKIIKKPKKRKLSEILNDIFKPDLEKIEQEESVFNKPYQSVGADVNNKFTLNDKDFKKLNDHIRKYPENIFSITEDINILTYKNNYLSEFKRQEVLLNVYNSFDVMVLASKVPPPTEATAVGGAGGMVAVAALAAAAGGGGGGGGGSSGPTLSFAVSSTSVGECDSDVTITANLTAAHSSDVTIIYTVGGTATKDTDYTISTTTSTLVAGSTSVSITISPTNDTTAETSETVIVAASVSGVSTTGNTSTTITIHDYVLKCNTTAFTEGSTSDQNTIKNQTAWKAFQGTTVRTDPVHPFNQMNLHKVQSFSSGSTALKGSTETIHIADFNCNDDHEIYDNKTVTNLDDGGSGESTFQTATAAKHHCQAVAAFANGDASSGRIGVAPEADIILSSIPDTNTHSTSAQAHAADLDIVRAAGAIVSNHSWGMADAFSGGDVDNAAEFDSYMTAQGFTIEETFGKLRHNDTGSSSIAAWNTWITALKNYQETGVIVFASGNDTAESDAGIMAAIPYWYDGTKHSTDLTKAWINAIVMEYTGDSDLTNIASSEVTLRGNPCGKTAAFCLSVDAWDMLSAEYVDGSGDSIYRLNSDSGSSFGSSYSAPMISGGIALMAQAFPNHTPEQLVDRVLASANNKFFTPDGNTTFTTHGASIVHGYDTTFGHGIPDFYAALSPITSSSNPASGFGFASPPQSGGGDGGGSVPFSQIKKLSVYDTSMKASSSFGDGIMNGLKGKTAYAYDALNGGFKYNVNDFINYDALAEQKIDHTLDQEINFLRNFRFSESKITKDFNVYAGEYINFRDKFNRGLSITLDQPNIALQNFNLYNNKDYKNPFTSENKGVGFNNKFYFFGNNVLLGYNNSKFNPLTSINDNLVVPMETLALSINLDSNNFDLLSFTTGLIKEENTFLLSKGSGAFNLNDKDNLSNFFGFNFSKNLNSLGNIYFSSMFGSSKLDNAKNSLIVDTSNVLSSSFEVNYELKNLFNNDQFSISLSQPNRVEKGDMTFRFVGLADKNGILPYQDHKLSLSPSGRQKDLIVSYYKNHSRNLKTGIKAVLTDDLGHVKNNSLDTSLLLSASYNF